MKKTNYFRYLAWSVLLMLLSLTGNAQTDSLRAAIEANPDDLESHRTYLATFDTADEAKKTYENWLKKYPKVAAIPLALAEKYGTYSPKAQAYLLKAAELDPSNAAVWEKLATDASFRGNLRLEQEYRVKAAEADPENLELQLSYIFSLNTDETLYKEKVMEFVDKHPNSEATINLLHIYGTDLKEADDRIEVWEMMRKMFGTGKTISEREAVSYQVAMTRLADAYLQTGQYRKTVDLCTAFQDAPARLHFSEKLTLAKTLDEVEKKIRDGAFAAAKDQIMPLDIQGKHLFDFGNRVVLLKATVLAGIGLPKSAYDSLVTFHSKTPDAVVKNSLEKYGQQLGKNKIQVEEDIRMAIAMRSRPAPAFELESYLSERKVKLEDLKGKVVLLSFWYPGCGPCRGEMPHIEAGIKNFDKSQLVYLGVNGQRNQDEFVLPFMKSTGYSFIPLGGTKEMLKDYGVWAYPTNFIIDKEGKIAYSGFKIEADDADMLELMVRSLL